LSDALGSVRQLVNMNSAITLTQSNAPYGEVIQSVGTSQTNYAFTGEMRDANGLIYLRARYYAPQDGRFLSRDTWDGDYTRPLSLNRWGYVEGNPVNAVDPSGHITIDNAENAEVLVNGLKTYNVFLEVDWGEFPYVVIEELDPFLRKNCGWFEGRWTLEELLELWYGVSDLAREMGGTSHFIQNIGGSIAVKKGLSPHKAFYRHSVKLPKFIPS